MLKSIIGNSKSIIGSGLVQSMLGVWCAVIQDNYRADTYPQYYASVLFCRTIKYFNVNKGEIAMYKLIQRKFQQ